MRWSMVPMLCLLLLAPAACSDSDEPGPMSAEDVPAADVVEDVGLPDADAIATDPGGDDEGGADETSPDAAEDATDTEDLPEDVPPDIEPDEGPPDADEDLPPEEVSDDVEDAGPDDIEDTGADEVEDADPGEVADGEDAIEDAGDGVDEVEDTAGDLPAEVDEDAPDDAEDCPPIEGDPPPPEEFPLIIGTSQAGELVPAEDGQEIEIVQGPQGGIHLEIALKATLPESFDTDFVKAEIMATTFQPCCATAAVGDYLSTNALLYENPPGSHEFVSSTLPVIFVEEEASFYQDDECCVAVTLAIFAPGATEPTLFGAGTHTFYCVDLF